MNAGAAFDQWRTEQSVEATGAMWAAFCAGWEAGSKAFGNCATPAPVEGTTKTVVCAETIYNRWPIKKGRGAAIPAIMKALKKRGYLELLDDVTAYAAAIATWKPEDRQFVPMCSTWMNQERWLDDRSTWVRGTVHKSQFGTSH